MNKSQKLNHVSNMLKAMQADGLLIKTESGKQWLITAKGKVELEA